MPITKQQELDKQLKECLDECESYIITYDRELDQAINLVRRGANPNIKSSKDNALIHYLAPKAIKNRAYKKFLNKLLTKYGAEVDILDAFNRTALKLILNSIERNYCSYISDGLRYFDVARILIDHGANPNILSADGNAFAHLLTYDTNYPSFCQHLTKLMANPQANINVLNDEDATPLQLVLDRIEHYPSKEVYPLQAIKLIRMGANPNDLSLEDNSFLHILTQYPHRIKHYKEYIHELVLKHHADIEIVNSDGKTPLAYAFNLIQKASYKNDIINAFLSLVRLGANTPKCLEKLNESQANFLFSLATSNSIYQFSATEQQARTNFLNLLCFMATDWHQPESLSIFHKTPWEIILHIFSFYDFSALGVRQEEGYQLLEMMMSHGPEIKAMSKVPGGINVMQRFDYQTQTSTFTLFKSATTLALDHDKITNDKTITSEAKIKKLTQFKPLEIWQTHIGLFSKDENKSALTHKLMATKLYQDDAIEAKMRAKMRW